MNAINTKLILPAVFLLTTIPAVEAAELEVTVTNLTQGIYYTPIIVAAHNGDTSIFRSGEMASSELQAMAEGGDISGVSLLLTGAAADISENPAEGLLAPAMSTTTMLSTSAGNNYLSIAAMILPSNDGFVGLDSWMIPMEAGTYSFTLNAYDAGTEANDEIVNGGGAPGVPGIPAAPGMDAGSGASGVSASQANTYVHIHPGNLGDMDVMGGSSDLNPTIHRWLNPVAKVTVVVK
ncbi:spondin domain-containing protein [Thalassotalea fonticola]|uniref:Spondin domain-containing protein n=1 Tax=Thalassotalea fonticola TaxID=3065649 RepID=A0ABZ0GPE4_9GAMM|nr:spondin domain-containing protein [Colwelliaceae bacterium S1-1]